MLYTQQFGNFDGHKPLFILGDSQSHLSSFLGLAAGV